MLRGATLADLLDLLAEEYARGCSAVPTLEQHRRQLLVQLFGSRHEGARAGRGTPRERVERAVAAIQAFGARLAPAWPPASVDCHQLAQRLLQRWEVARTAILPPQPRRRRPRAAPLRDK